MKLAILMGATGAGKGEVVKNIQRAHVTIELDRIRSDVLKPFRNLLRPKLINRWPIWTALVSRFDVVPALAKAVHERYPNMDGSQPVLAEGGLLAHAGFQAAFVAAIEQTGLVIVEQRLFWLDPDVSRIFYNKTELRKRPGEINIKPEKVKKLVRFYRSQASQFDCTRSSEVLDVAAAIDQFFA